MLLHWEISKGRLYIRGRVLFTGAKVLTCNSTRHTITSHYLKYVCSESFRTGNPQLTTMLEWGNDRLKSHEDTREVYDSGPRLLFQLCWLCWLWNCEESFGEVRWCSSHSVIPSYPPILTPADAPDSLDLQAHVLRWPAGSQHPGALKLGNLLCLYSDSLGCSSSMSSSSSNPNNLVSSLWIGMASYKVEDFFFQFSFWTSKLKFLNDGIEHSAWRFLREALISPPALWVACPLATLVGNTQLEVEDFAR